MVKKIKLISDQKKYLRLVLEKLEREWGADDLQNALYDTARDNNIDTGMAIQAIYLPVTGKTRGPKASRFLLSLDKDMLIERYNKAII